MEVLVASSRTSENFKLSFKTPAVYMVPEQAVPMDEIGAAYWSLNYLLASALPAARERRVPRALVLHVLRDKRIKNATKADSQEQQLSAQMASIWAQMLVLHEQVEQHWGQRRATNFHLLSAVEVLAESLGDIVPSTVVAVLLGVVGSRLAEVSRNLDLDCM